MKSSESFTYTDKDMHKGVVKLMILSYIRNHKTYPYALLKVIKSLKTVHGYNRYKMLGSISKNDIYNLTSALEKEGYIKSKATLNGNKVQKVFTITKKGENVVKNKDKILFSMINQMKKLVKEEFNA